MSSIPLDVGLVCGEAIARYGFGDDHPFGPDRHDVFLSELGQEGLTERLQLIDPRPATDAELTAFHEARYIDFVRERSELGVGYLDHGDTPALRGIFEAAANVAGATLAAVEAVLEARCRHAFVPIAGLHHARRGRAGGFCVFNDVGIAVEALRRRGLRRIAYVDIDAHHGDGVFYGFEDDPELFFADLHEDPRFLYPGTGFAEETGKGAAAGTKLNVPMRPGAGDAEFALAWRRVVRFLHNVEPEFILFQCGADSLAGDPITHLCYSEEAHAAAAASLAQIAARHCQGRLVAMGGGGYNRRNLARAWVRVVRALLEHADP